MIIKSTIKKYILVINDCYHSMKNWYLGSGIDPDCLGYRLIAPPGCQSLHKILFVCYTICCTNYICVCVNIRICVRSSLNVQFLVNFEYIKYNLTFQNYYYITWITSLFLLLQYIIHVMTSKFFWSDIWAKGMGKWLSISGEEITKFLSNFETKNKFWELRSLLCCHALALVVSPSLLM